MRRSLCNRARTSARGGVSFSSTAGTMAGLRRGHNGRLFCGKLTTLGGVACGGQEYAARVPRLLRRRRTGACLCSRWEMRRAGSSLSQTDAASRSRIIRTGALLPRDQALRRALQDLGRAPPSCRDQRQPRAPEDPRLACCRRRRGAGCVDGGGLACKLVRMSAHYGGSNTCGNRVPSGHEESRDGRRCPAACHLPR